MEDKKIIHLKNVCRISEFKEVNADVAQLVEHFHGKEKVTGSIPVIGSEVRKRSPREICGIGKRFFECEM